MLLEQLIKVLEKVLEKRVMCQLITCSLASCLEREPLMPFSSCDNTTNTRKTPRKEAVLRLHGFREGIR